MRKRFGCSNQLAAMLPVEAEATTSKSWRGELCEPSLLQLLRLAELVPPKTALLFGLHAHGDGARDRIHPCDFAEWNAPRHSFQISDRRQVDREFVRRYRHGCVLNFRARPNFIEELCPVGGGRKLDNA